jgi:hypothetical protein
MPFFVRQGDIVIRKTEKPVTGVLKEDRIIAYGEVTGHTHTVIGDAKVFETANQLMIDVAGTAEVIHQEHKTITLPKGIYEVVGQREWTDANERKVTD